MSAVSRTSSLLVLVAMTAAVPITAPPVVAATPAGQDEGAGEAAPLAAHPEAWLVLPAVDRRGRRPFRPDAVFRDHLLDPSSAPPREGGAVVGELGERQVWERRESDDRGSPGGGAAWAHARFASATDQVVMARLEGASTLFVNGDAFVGDVYRYGWPGVPVALRAGVNDLYVTGIRGDFTFELAPLADTLVIGTWDLTRPDLVRGEGDPGPLGLLVLNGSLEAADGVLVRVEEERAGVTGVARGVAGLVPLGLRKLAVPLQRTGELDGDGGSLSLEATVEAGGRSSSAELRLDVLDPDGPQRRRSFTSAIDGSAQFYAERPATGGSDAEHGLVLSLHGAGVDAHGQAGCYAPRADLWFVAPTNRRPFGFDWQDWGRQDAYEVLHHALARSGVSRQRVSVTGHSMGGHGTWHLAANDPDGFAVVAPSAGWRSFDSYGGRPEGSLSSLWHQADGASLTETLLDNLVQRPVAIVHGTRDATVPADEALAMFEALTEAGADVGLHLERDAGHWWDRDDLPGVGCLDRPELTALYRRERLPLEPRELRFTTVSPGVDHSHHWVSVEQVLDQTRPARVEARVDDEVVVSTENVRRLVVRVPSPTTSCDHGDAGEHGGALDAEDRVDEAASEEPAPAGGRPRPEGMCDDCAARPASLRLDGTPFEVTRSLASAFLRDGSGWRVAELDSSEKTPRRRGPFKRAFDRGFLLVVGTAGTPEETAALLARARHDAQVWWYRGNGDAPVVTDREVLEHGYPEHNLILYGNADTNAAWSQVLGEDRPVEARRGRLSLGAQVWTGDDRAAVFVRPRAGSSVHQVGVFADTGVAGTRLGYTLAPFVSGVGYPDYALFDASVLSAGDDGVLAAGFFDARWELSDDPGR